MKTLRLLYILFLLSFCSYSYAQSGHSITGTVFDTLTSKPVEFAAVSVRDSVSPKIIQAAAADSLGRFELKNLAVGKYLMTVSLIGYQSKTIPVVVTDQKKTTDIGKLQLTAENKELGETVVLSEKPVIRIEAGKIVFDVAKTITDGSETAMEAMQKIPGVTVTQDGSVTVKGRSGVKYLVDGKPSPMAQSNPEAFLKSIPSKNIESIEINTNPSAKYDASGSAAIINIHLKKGKLEGLNGSISAGVGTVFDKYNGSGNINYKKGKINFFANAYVRDEVQKGSSLTDTRVTIDSSVANYHSTSASNNHSRSASGKIGAEYSVDKHNSITYALDGSYWGSRNSGNGTMLVSDPGTPTLARRQTPYGSTYDDLNITNSLNYRRTWDSLERSLTIDVAHTIEKQNSGNKNVSTALDSAGNELTALDFYKRTHNYGTNQNILLQSDFTTLLKKRKSAKIESGVKEEINLHNTTADVYDMVSSAEQKDSLQSTIFKYTESITAAYMTFSDKVKKFSYSGGLRWEQTYIRSDFSQVNQSYASLFPSATIGWQFNDKHGLTASYSRRIDRPGFWLLNNAVHYNSPYSIWRGNPNIKPSFVNGVELSYNAQIKDQNLNISASYAKEAGSAQSISRTDAQRVTTTTYENIGSTDVAYGGVDCQFKFTKWWTASVSLSYSYNWYIYSLNGVLTHSQGGSGDMSGNMTFKFWKNASLSFWGWGSTGWVGAQERNKPVGSLTATIKKKFFKDKLTIALSCRDVLGTMRWRSSTTTPQMYTYSSYNPYGRIGYLTLTYQFGKETFTPETKGKSSRMGGGGGGGGGH